MSIFPGLVLHGPGQASDSALACVHSSSLRVEGRPLEECKSGHSGGGGSFGLYWPLRAGAPTTVGTESLDRVGYLVDHTEGLPLMRAGSRPLATKRSGHAQNSRAEPTDQPLGD